MFYNVLWEYIPMAGEESRVLQNIAEHGRTWQFLEAVAQYRERMQRSMLDCSKLARQANSERQEP
jgi:hypothetical protein